MYYGQTVNAHSVLEFLLLAFVIGVAAGLIWNYGAATLSYVLMRG